MTYTVSSGTLNPTQRSNVQHPTQNFIDYFGDNLASQSLDWCKVLVCKGLTSHSTDNRSFPRRPLPGNHSTGVTTRSSKTKCNEIKACCVGILRHPTRKPRQWKSSHTAHIEKRRLPTDHITTQHSKQKAP